MAYNPEKTNANTSGEKSPKSSKPVSEKLARGLGKTAIGGKK
jgi:hypothetical protein